MTTVNADELDRRETKMFKGALIMLTSAGSKARATRTLKTILQINPRNHQRYQVPWNPFRRRMFKNSVSNDIHSSAGAAFCRR